MLQNTGNAWEYGHFFLQYAMFQFDFEIQYAFRLNSKKLLLTVLHESLIELHKFPLTAVSKAQ